MTAIQPSRGRLFAAAEHKAGVKAVALMLHEAWTTKFGSDASILETIATRLEA